MEERIGHLLAGVLVGGSYALGAASVITAALYAATCLLDRAGVRRDLPARSRGRADDTRQG